MSNTTKFALGFFTAITLSGLIVFLRAQAFNGPSSAAGVGSGALAVGSSSNYFSIGTSTASSTVNLLIVGSTTDNTAYGLEVMNSSLSPLLTVRNDGVVSVGTSTISGGSFAGTVSAGNISSGQFGSNTGGGNYSFPANVAIGTTTAATLFSVATTTTIFNVLSSGNVGVGLKNPAQQFDSDNPSNTSSTYMLVSTNGALSPRLLMGYGYAWNGNVTTTAAQLVADQNGNLDIATRNNNTSSINFYTSTGSGSNFVMGVNSNGDVGIGTSTPNGTLEVYSSSNNYATLITDPSASTYMGLYFDAVPTGSNYFLASNGSNSYVMSPSATGQLQLGTGGTTRETILSTGNVGIGTTTPVSTLQVDATTSSTVEIGATGATGCLKMHAASGTIGATIWVYFDSNAVMYATTTKPSFCD